MTKAVRGALWILVPSLVVVAVSHVASWAFPQTWGGPNIGGGLILLVAYVGVAVGLVRLGIAWRHRHPDRAPR